MQTAVVTGSSSGLGAALTDQLLRSGYSVVGISRRPVEGKANYRHIQSDLTLDEDLETVAKLFAEVGPPPALLVNSASLATFGKTGTYSVESIKTTIQTNLVVPITLADAALKAWKNSGQAGTIVNILSTAAFTARANETSYCAAKAGLKMWADAARLDIKGSGIRILNVFPGGMRTPFWDNVPGSDPSGYSDPVEVAETISSIIAPGATSAVTDITINRKS